MHPDPLVCICYIDKSSTRIQTRTQPAEPSLMMELALVQKNRVTAASPNLTVRSLQWVSVICTRACVQPLGLSALGFTCDPEEEQKHRLSHCFMKKGPKR